PALQSVQRACGHDPHPAAVHDPHPLQRDARHRPQPAPRGAESGCHPLERFPACLPAAQPSGHLWWLRAGVHPLPRLLHHACAVGRSGRLHDLHVHLRAGQRVARLGLRRVAGAGPPGEHDCDLPGRQSLRQAPTHLLRSLMSAAGWHGTGRWRRLSLGRAALVLACALIFLFLVAPLLIVIPVSFSSAPYLVFPPPGFSLQWYQSYFGQGNWLGPTLLSAEVATSVALLATLLGVPAAMALVRGRFPARGLINALALSPMIVPEIIIAIAVFYAFASVHLVGHVLGLIVAQTALGL